MRIPYSDCTPPPGKRSSATGNQRDLVGDQRFSPSPSSVGGVPVAQLFLSGVSPPAIAESSLFIASPIANDDLRGSLFLI